MPPNGSGAERRATIGGPAKPDTAAERVRSSDWLAGKSILLPLHIRIQVDGDRVLDANRRPAPRRRLESPLAKGGENCGIDSRMARNCWSCIGDKPTFIDDQYVAATFTRNMATRKS